MEMFKEKNRVLTTFKLHNYDERAHLLPRTIMCSFGGVDIILISSDDIVYICHLTFH